RLDPNLCLVQPGAPTGGALPGLHKFVFIEDEVAGSTPGRFDNNPMTRGAGGTDHMTEILLHVLSSQPQIARQRRDRSRFGGEQLQQVATKGQDRKSTRLNS